MRDDRKNWKTGSVLSELGCGKLIQDGIFPGKGKVPEVHRVSLK